MSNDVSAPDLTSLDDLIDQLRDDAAGSALLRLRRLDDAPGLTRLLDHVDLLSHRDPGRVEQLTALCDRTARTPALAGIRARARYLRAKLLAQRGDLSTAEKLIDQAHHLWLSVGDEVAALRTNLGRMQVLNDLGRHDAAVQVGQDLIGTLDRRGGDDPAAALLRAQATENLGISYGLTGRTNLALDAYLQAEAGYRDVGMLKESGLPRANRGVELLALGRPREALIDFAHAQAIFTATGDDLFAAQCRGDAAQAHRQLGEFAQALRLLEQARQTLERLGATVEADRLRLALAETYLEAGLATEARDAAVQASDATAHTGRTPDQAMAYYLTALSDLALGQPTLALATLQEAETLFEQVGDLQYTARVRLSRAEANIMVGRTDQARVLLDGCERDLRDGGWPIPSVWASLRRVDLSETLEEARQHLDRAVRWVKELDLPEVTYQYELRAARIDRDGGDLAAAENRLRRALTAVETVSGVLPDHTVRAAFRADRFKAHSELVHLLVERGGDGDVSRAAAIADTAKARTLVELLNHPGGTSPAPSLPTDDEFAAVFAELSSTYLELQSEQRPIIREELSRSAERLEHQVTALRLRCQDEPEQASVTTVPEVDAAPDAHAPLVSYYVVGDDILSFVSLDGRITERRLRGALPQVHAVLDQLADQWTRFTLALGLELVCRDDLLRTAKDNLATLHDLLIAPLSDLLEGGGDRLCVVPHGPMGAVPFHALFDGRHYLLERWAVTVAPTRTASAASGVPVDCAGPAVVVAVADSFAPAVRREADLVAGVLSSAVLLADDAATTESFIAASVGARVVHLASHGVHRESSPLFSRLRFADRWMTSEEIIHLDLAGTLVVLSACESGAHGRAAEPIGLGWAFLAAGAAGVLVSLWDVHDEATLTLMAEFYRLLAAGASTDQALRAAQLHTAQHYPHPFYWAPFSYVASPHTTSRSMHP